MQRQLLAKTTPSYRPCELGREGNGLLAGSRRAFR
jgi:hypothetical protein